MDRIFDRLGDVIKNFLDDEDDKLFPGGRKPGSSGDPDLDAAYAELNDFLKTDRDSAADRRSRPAASGPRPAGWSDGPGASQAPRRPAGPPGVPESLRADFAELGVAFGAGADDCKLAYKKLLKIHHPDRHAGHPGNMKKATEKSSRINASYQRIERWRETGRTD
jgi:DnaJ-domain-containing protein 1